MPAIGEDLLKMSFNMAYVRMLFLFFAYKWFAKEVQSSFLSLKLNTHIDSHVVSIKRVTWVPPCAGKLKLNTDGSCNSTQFFFFFCEDQ